MASIIDIKNLDNNTICISSMYPFRGAKFSVSRENNPKIFEVVDKLLDTLNWLKSKGNGSAFIQMDPSVCEYYETIESMLFRRKCDRTLTLHKDCIDIVFHDNIYDMDLVVFMNQTISTDIIPTYEAYER